MEYKIGTRTVCRFGISDRIRILVRGVAVVSVSTITENLPGQAKSESSVHVPKVFQRKQKKIHGEGAGEVAKKYITKEGHSQ